MSNQYLTEIVRGCTIASLVLTLPPVTNDNDSDNIYQKIVSPIQIEKVVFMDSQEQSYSMPRIEIGSQNQFLIEQSAISRDEEDFRVIMDFAKRFLVSSLRTST